MAALAAHQLGSARRRSSSPRLSSLTSCRVKSRSPLRVGMSRRPGGSLSYIAGGDGTEQLKRLVAGNELPEDRPGGRYSRCLRPAVDAHSCSLARSWPPATPPVQSGRPLGGASSRPGGITAIGRRLLTRPAAMLACKQREKARDADQIP